MNNFIYSQPTRILFGRGCEEYLAEELRRENVSKVLLHYGGGSVLQSGLLHKIEGILDKNGIGYVRLGGVKPNPRLSLVHEGVDLARKEGVGLILAVGGGSVIDSAKAIAMGVSYSGNVWDFYAGKAEPASALPVATVLTIPAAGSEASPSSVITNEDGFFKKGLTYDGIRPVFSILNPEFTFTLPPYQSAAGATDIMAHVMERYFVAEKHVDYSDRLCESTLKTVIRNLPVVLEDPTHYDARAEIMWAATLAHNDLLSCGRGSYGKRAGDWTAHHMEHELSAIYDIAHGAGLAIIFPAWMKYIYKDHIDRFAQFATRVWGIEYDYTSPERTALEGITATEEFFRSAGMPVKLSQAGIPVDRMGEMAAKCTDNGEKTEGSYQQLTVRDVEKIYNLAL